MPVGCRHAHAHPSAQLAFLATNGPLRLFNLCERQTSLLQVQPAGICQAEPASGTSQQLHAKARLKPGQRPAEHRRCRRQRDGSCADCALLHHMYEGLHIA
ncbi:hypothetical protein D3C85_1103030 [compost metagenome]